ncbi:MULTISPECIES: TerB family tellurite resistance protein [unclassified Streptomyces]|uniref:TerB family tellurite resistance protein n=1 Tax=unclassified Streptomyces TaxID=2593676 RepID=UPI002E315E9F|nr:MULTISPECIES: TerB family tellurite resistance protein [unclassified Streptomyces]WUC66525.1 TerB family tellurite resistance protein [Streptomyces sp. NBC_00539]
MLPVRGGDGRKLTVWGIRTTWSTVADGEFFCPGCGGDRNYRRRTGRRRFAVLGVPLLPRGSAGPVVECQACKERFGTDVLDHLTTTRFSAMLRDAVHTVTLAVLAAGGTTSRSALEAAVAAVRGAGFQDCTQEQLEAVVDALATDEGRLGLYDGPECCGAALSIELHEALEPLAPHLAGPGRASLLLQGARIALADGPYIPAEREVLATVGAALRMGADEVARLLSAVRAP